MVEATRAPVLTGGCQCGAVRYALYAEPSSADICHCRMCQRAVGNLFMAVAGVAQGEFAWTRGAPALFRSSSAAERGFCRDCGTPLTFRYLARDQINVTLGSLDEPESRVSMLERDPLHYALLAELNTRPRTRYLASLRNPNPALDEFERPFDG